jgi:hypothetical protein
MGELSEEAEHQVLGTFLRSYNEHNGSSYVIEEREPNEDLSCDYKCVDVQRTEPLKVQVTRAALPVEVQGLDGPSSDPMHAWVANKRRGGGIILETAGKLVLRAVTDKAERLGPSASDLVLLILFDLKRYDAEDDLMEMRSAARTAARRAEKRHAARFREVWSVWGYVDEPGEAHILWPTPVPRRIASGLPRRCEACRHAVDYEGILHVLDREAGEALCGAYVVDTNAPAGSPMCEECKSLLLGDEHPVA